MGTKIGERNRQKGRDNKWIKGNNLTIEREIIWQHSWGRVLIFKSFLSMRFKVQCDALFNKILNDKYEIKITDKAYFN